MNTQPTDLVRVVRLVPGTLILRFQNAIDFSNERDFIIDSRVEFARLPLSFAVSLFQLPETYQMYKKGYFTFADEDKDKVFKYARELQIYFGDEVEAKKEQPSVLYTEKQIESFIKLGRIKEITQILEESTLPQKQLLVSAAQKLAGKITMDIVKLIEEKLGVDISEGDE
jgi:hypothetical protein